MKIVREGANPRNLVNTWTKKQFLSVGTISSLLKLKVGE